MLHMLLMMVTEALALKRPARTKLSRDVDVDLILENR